MASPHIENWFKEKLAELLPEAPFMDTIGTLNSPKGLPPIWSTLEIPPGGTQRLSIGSPYLDRQYGSAMFVVLVKSGAGNGVLGEYLQRLYDLLPGVSDAQILEPSTGIIGHFILSNIGPPTTEPFEDGNWLAGSISCVYTYDSVRGPAAA